MNDILNHLAPLKKRVKGNYALFMTKDLRKAIRNKSRAKSKWEPNMQQTEICETIYYINIVGKSSGEKLLSLGNSSDAS